MLTSKEKQNYMWGRRPSSSHGNTISLAIIFFTGLLPSPTCT